MAMLRRPINISTLFEIFGVLKIDVSFIMLEIHSRGCNYVNTLYCSGDARYLDFLSRNSLDIGFRNLITTTIPPKIATITK